MEDIKFLKKGIKHDGKYVPVWYSGGEIRGEPKGTITIYAKKYGSELPLRLDPENDSDIRTDLFMKDRARIRPGSPFYKQVKKYVNV